MPVTAKLHADIARAIADGDEERAATASDRLLDNIEKFTRDTVGTDV
jgi:DNA-binding FadR family transcriptional regulator